jgi:hypothetical protein
MKTECLLYHLRQPRWQKLLLHGAGESLAEYNVNGMLVPLPHQMHHLGVDAAALVSAAQK